MLIGDPVARAAAEALDRQTFEGLGCPRHGIVVLQGQESWNAHERGIIELPWKDEVLGIPVAYDERGGPYAVDHEGHERRDLLLSLTDEDDLIACAWAERGPSSPLRGLGIDLSDRSHFDRPPGKRDLAALLFREDERALDPPLEADDPLLNYAALFGAKEAAFKATAAPLRQWYRSHDEELLFEVRHFVMEQSGLERGTGRNAAAQRALDRMGIGRIVVTHTTVGTKALVCAVALPTI